MDEKKDIIVTGANVEITDVAGLGPFAKRLFSTIDKVIGPYIKWHLTVKQAEADSTAAAIKARSEVEVALILNESTENRMNLSLQHQENVESVINKSIEHQSHKIQEGQIEVDWMARFLDEVKYASTDELRELWSRVLANEVTQPGTISKRTMTILRDISKEEAESFTKVCSCGFWAPESEYPHLLIASQLTEELDKIGLQYTDISNLSSIGLLDVAHGNQQYDGLAKRDDDDDLTIRFQHMNKMYIFDANPGHLTEDKNGIRYPCGVVMLTKIGQEMATILTPSELADSYVQAVIDYMKDHSIAYAKVVNEH